MYGGKRPEGEMAGFRSHTHTFDSAKQTRDRNFSRLACPSAGHLVASNC